MIAEPLLSLAVSVAAEHSVQGVLNTIVRGLAAQPHVALARIWLVSPGDICNSCFMRAECPDHTQCLHLTASAGNPANSPGEDWTFLQGHFRRIPLHVRKVGEVGATENPILIKDFAPENQWIARPDWARREGIRSFAGHPLVFQRKILGVLALFSREPLSEQDSTWIGIFANQAAVALANAQAFEEIARGEEALRERANLLDLTHDTVFVRDINDVITFWNRGAEKLYGWTRDEAVGQVSHQLMQTIFPAPLAEITAELNSTGRWEAELIQTRRDGTQVVVASRWALQLDGRGKPVAVLETNHDITERKRAEEALHKARAELAHVTRVATLGEMTASIAHEVNQPLAAVIANANACLRWLARQSPDLDEARAAVERIIRDGHRASEVIGRVRALVKKSPPRKDWLDINETILEVIALARSDVHGNRVALQTQLSDDVPRILGDRIQLQQVILNLIVNAIEAMSGVSDGPREILVSSGKYESNGVVVAVQDSGIGLAAESLEHLFDAFFTTKPSGMGMGLAISRTIIEAHGGRLWATPNDGPGATFQFTLPLPSARQS
jgi:two-component system, LuxR family, sensor kinase FixL